MLTTRQLTLWRGYRCLFEDLQFEIGSGRVGVVRGPNGSGKTTLLRVLAGLTRAETGEVLWRGQNIEADRAGFGAQMAYLGHATGLKADLTPEQNLDFARRLGRGAADDEAATWTALDLDAIRTLPVRYLSAGQQRRVALARLLNSTADLWLMDEPLTNLDARGRAFVSASLARHLQRGGAAVVATHSELDLPDTDCVAVQLGEAA